MGYLTTAIINSITELDKQETLNDEQIETLQLSEAEMAELDAE
ncbi:hypothetical protein [Pseudomonas sp. NPDC089534]